MRPALLDGPTSWIVAREDESDEPGARVRTVAASASQVGRLDRETPMAPRTRTTKADRPVKDFIDSLEDEQTAKDGLVLIGKMRRISKRQPKMWNVGTVGFDAYHYKYDSGREGDCHALGFYPRKGRITVHLMDGTSRHAELLSRLGKHTTSRVCLYIKRLADVQLPVLEQIVRQSYAYLKSQDGQVRRVE